MSGYKKKIMYLFIILLVFSLYKDLTVGTNVGTSERTDEKVHEPTKNSENLNASMRVKVMHGDTVLSIIEDINEELPAPLNIEQMLHDFSKLNPTVDPKNLTAGKFYAFPLYTKGTDQ